MIGVLGLRFEKWLSSRIKKAANLLRGLHK